MPITAAQRQALEEDEWDIESESPLSIRHRITGSFATDLAAELAAQALEALCAKRMFKGAVMLTSE